MSFLLAIALGAAGAPEARLLTEKQALEIAAKVMRQREPAVPTRCLTFSSDGDSEMFGIEVRDNHKCDPKNAGIAIMLGSFQLDRSPVRLRIFDFRRHDYVPCHLSKSLIPNCPQN